MNDKVHFIVGSVGRTATQWLTSALNRHPDIFATHGADWQPAKGEADHTASNHLRRERVLDWLRSGQVLDIDRYFGIFAQRAERFCGNIHGVDIVGPYLYPQNYRTRLHICHLTRHPVPRIQSMVWKCRRMGEEHPRHRDMMSEFYTQHVGKVAEILAMYNVRPIGEDQENFVSCLLLVMNGDAASLRLTAPMFRMEEVTCRPERFAALVRHITAGQLTLSPGELAGMMEAPPVDTQARTRDAAQIMDEWEDWQRGLFRHYLERTHLRPIYADIGYTV